MPDLSIVIVNYNTRDELRDCLESILAHRGDLSIETLVVDNVSQDGSAAMVRQFAPDVTLIEPGDNTWFTGGNNIGMRAATGEFVWILNPDTIVQADTMQIMVRYLREHAETGAVTCRMHFPDGRFQRTCSMVPRYLDLLSGYTLVGVIFSRWRDRRHRTMFYADWSRDSIRAVEVAPGSNILCRRSVLAESGLFDEAQKLYFTEDDLCRRINASGYPIHFLPDALLLHHEHTSVQKVQRLASQIYFDDLLVYCRKYYGPVLTLLLHALIIPTRYGMNLMQRLRGEHRTLSG